MILDRHVLAFDVTGFVEALAERDGKARAGIGRPRSEKRDNRHRRLLCARGERPCRSTAENGDELAPFHSINSSARASSAGGTVRLNAFAVLRLMRSSTLVACWTGNSAGFSPLSIRPV